jgi:uncharacterized protein YbjQ (UPF0145 family)
MTKDPFHSMVTTAFELPGFKIISNKGIARGIIVRSRSIVGGIGAAFQTLFGGDITLWTTMCEDTRRDAFDRMIMNAKIMGANAVIGFRYESNEIAQGCAEVLAYGTAVVVE